MERIFGFLIDPWERTITTAALPKEDSLHEMYRLIGCELVETVMLTAADDGSQETLWVDEEGLLKEPEQIKPFNIVLGTTPRTHLVELVGRALLLATDPDGYCQSTKVPEEELRRRVFFEQPDAPGVFVRADAGPPRST